MQMYIASILLRKDLCHERQFLHFKQQWLKLYSSTVGLYFEIRIYYFILLPWLLLIDTLCVFRSVCRFIFCESFKIWNESNYSFIVEKKINFLCKPMINIFPDDTFEQVSNLLYHVKIYKSHVFRIENFLEEKWCICYCNNFLTTHPHN